jgi:predicted branched-subunit amino acid permease
MVRRKTVIASPAETTLICMLSSRTEFLNGAKAELPILLGVLPFGMI